MLPQEAVYDEWFVPMLDQMPTLVPHGFIYLRTKADTCARRLKKRNRSEEAGVKLDYLEGIQVCKGARKTCCMPLIALWHAQPYIHEFVLVEALWFLRSALMLHPMLSRLLCYSPLSYL